MKKTGAPDSRFKSNRHSCRNAFSLIEVVIYLSLLLILSFVISGICKQVKEYFLFLSATREKILRRALFFDIVRRDLICADLRFMECGCSGRNPPHPECPEGFRDAKLSRRMERESDCFIFRKSSLLLKRKVTIQDVGFHLRENKVYRSEGLYDYSQKTWAKKFVVLVATRVESIEWEVDKRHTCRKEGFMHGVDVGIRFEKSARDYHSYIRVRNGVV